MPFYRINPDNNTQLDIAPNRVHSPRVTLLKTKSSDRTRIDSPDGWRWFDTDEEAVSHYKLETFQDYRRKRALAILDEQGIDLQAEYREKVLGHKK